MEDYRHGSHTVSWLSVHLVWVTKNRYHVLTGDVQFRCRDIVSQICDSENVRILQGSSEQRPCPSSHRVSPIVECEYVGEEIEGPNFAPSSA